MKRQNIFALALGAGTCLLASQGFAHHVADGQLPNSAVQGLLSGLAHPVIGIDHLAFLILMGAAAIYTPRPLLAPLAFVVSTVAGCLLVVAGVQFPGIELGVTASVIIGGAIVLSGRKYSPALYLGLFAAAGLLHGGAYGAAIVGAQVDALVAYLVGFACIEYIISVAFGLFLGRSRAARGGSVIHSRLAGALAAGIGVALFIENIEAVLALG